MILPVHQLVRRRVADTVGRLYSLPPDDAAIAEMALEMPPRRALGDIAVPVAFALARRLRKAPRAIAQELAAALGPIDGVVRVEAAPNGYLNFFLDRAFWLQQWIGGPGESGGVRVQAEEHKTIVEHTAINPNKAAHIGHLRNAALGDAFGRLLRFQGRPVEIQNYIDDTGVQVADVVVGLRELEGKTLAEERAIADSTRFDYYCWDLYAKVTDWYGADTDPAKPRLKIRTAALHNIEHGGNETAEMAAFVADRIVRAHLKTMGRLNIRYDLLTWEGDILRMKFWAHAFEFLKKTGEVFVQTEGKLAGCWVMKIDEDADGAADAEAAEVAEAAAAAAAEGAEPQREKVIVRSDGTVTYVGKDIALQMWKFGLLDRDFYYRVFAESPAPPLWSTSSDAATAAATHPAFGRASMVCNVIDTRQAYLQKLLKQALAALGFGGQARRSIHYSYEMVALTHNTARELGYEPDDSGKPFVEVSGRKGLGVKADDLLDRLTAKAAGEVARRNAEFTGDEVRRTAEMIAVAAVRYFMVKFSRGKVIAFDIDEAVSFEGETGPYLQYAVVRANNIFAKLKDREGLDAAGVAAALPSTAPEAIAGGSDDSHELWGLVLEAARLDEVVDQAIRTLELSVVAKYAFALAQQFNGFYHSYPILKEERADVRLWRAAAVAYYRGQLTRALDLMGCAVPERM
ncbi:MAG TPA: arginine--tRNA ligase [Vicinamibacterales bacterium]|nr:arginine--tRNA ligase [Vicinamibacterales bacterium]